MKYNCYIILFLSLKALCKVQNPDSCFISSFQAYGGSATGTDYDDQDILAASPSFTPQHRMSHIEYCVSQTYKINGLTASASINGNEVIKLNTYGTLLGNCQTYQLEAKETITRILMLFSLTEVTGIILTTSSSAKIVIGSESKIGVYQLQQDFTQQLPFIGLFGTTEVNNLVLKRPLRLGFITISTEKCIIVNDLTIDASTD